MIGRERVTLQRQERTRQPGGGWSVEWVDVATVRMRVQPLDGFELMQAMQMGMQRPYRLEGWRVEGVTGAMRAIYHARSGDRVLDITSVKDGRDRARKMVVLANEEVVE